MKVLWISHGATLQGAERCLLEAILWTRPTIESAVVLPHRGPLLQGLDEAGARTFVIRHPWWLVEFTHKGLFSIIRRYVSAVVRICVAIIKFRPDLVVTNSLVCPSGAIAARIMRIPHVWYAHEFVEEDHGWHFSLGAPRSLRFVGANSRLIIANSEAVKRKLAHHIPPEKIVRLYFPPVLPKNAANFFGDSRPDHGFTIGIIGRKTLGKGQEQAVEAVYRLRQEGIEATLHLIGPDHNGYESELKRIAEGLGVGSSMCFVPFQPYSLDLYSNLDVVAVCSRSEAYGRVTVEAMLMGRAVVASDAGANLELIRDGDTGLLYRAGDAKELAAALRRLHDDPVLRDRIGRNARAFAERVFSHDSYAAELVDQLKAAAGISSPTAARIDS